MQYPFDNLSALHRGRVRPRDAADLSVASAMTDALARFVKTGDPNGGQLPMWPRYTVTGEPYLEFGSEIQTRTAGDGRALDMIRAYYAGQCR